MSNQMESCKKGESISDTLRTKDCTTCDRACNDAKLSSQQRQEKVEEENDSEAANPLLEYIEANVIGRDTMFRGPYGCRQGNARVCI